MSTFKQLVEDYEKEYDSYVKFGLSDEDALALVTKHIREGKKAFIKDIKEEPKQEEPSKAESKEEPKKEEPKKPVEKKEEPKCACKKYDDWFNDFNKLFNYDNFVSKMQDNFWNSFFKEEKKAEPKPEPKKEEPKKEPTEKSVIEKQLNQLVAGNDGSKITIISNKPNHIEYEVQKPGGGYYKYCYKEF